jgi:hypothetical protein
MGSASGPAQYAMVQTAFADFSSKLESMSQRPSRPTPSRNHLMYGPGRLLKASKHKAVSSVITGPLDRRAASRHFHLATSSTVPWISGTIKMMIRLLYNLRSMLILFNLTTSSPRIACISDHFLWLPVTNAASGIISSICRVVIRASLIGGNADQGFRNRLI